MIFESSSQVDVLSNYPHADATNYFINIFDDFELLEDLAESQPSHSSATQVSFTPHSTRSTTKNRKRVPENPLNFLLFNPGKEIQI